MKNITLTLDDETASWARIHAARRNLSVSRFVSELLQTNMRETHAYEEAMQRYLSKEPFAMNSAGKPYPRRDELYD